MANVPINASPDVNPFRSRRSFRLTLIRSGSLLLIFLAAALLPPWLPVPDASAAQINSLTVVKENGVLSVSAEIKLDQAQIDDLNNGMPKELTFYLDLFRNWPVWPNEFIYGVRQVRTLKSDPVKKEFALTTEDAGKTVEMRFNSLETLLAEALKIDRNRMLYTGGLPPGAYFVRLTVESRIRRLAPLIGYLLFFVPEKEFIVVRDSGQFRVEKK